MRRTFGLATLGSVILLLASGALAAPPDHPANEFQLLTGYVAKEGCSCVFVEGQTDAYCTNYAIAPTGYNNITVAIDHTANTVTATFSGSTRTATFTAGKGCVLAGL